MITRLTKQWQAEQRDFAQRRLDDRDFVYPWTDGAHFNVRLEEARLCCLVIVGVRTDGTRELVAITDGHRESTDSWSDLLRELNPIEPTFSTVAPDQGHQGTGSQAAGLALAFKLIEAAEQRWRSINAPHLVALVRAGTKLDKGVMIGTTGSTGLDYFSPGRGTVRGAHAGRANWRLGQRRRLAP